MTEGKPDSCLNVSSADEDRELRRVSRNSTTATNVEPTCILIVDDDASTRLLLVETLKNDGFSTIEAPDGETAVSLVAMAMPDLVLMDVRMPGIDGFAACETIRANPGGKHVPIIMVTSLEDTESVDKAYQSGATDFVCKPIVWSLITHRVRYVLRSSRNHQSLLQSEARNASLLDSLPDIKYLLNHDGEVLQFLGGDWVASGLDVNAYVGRRIDEILPSTHSRTVGQCIQDTLNSGQVQTVEIEYPRDDNGQMSDMELRCIPYQGDTVLLVSRDVTQRKRFDAKIHQLAFYDGLTGLPNRELFEQHLSSAINESHQHGERLALLYIDLDRFKRINDNLGHGIGDALLKSVAERLLNSVREDDLISRATNDSVREVSRLGGDEFVVLLTHVKEEGHVLDVADRIQRSLVQPFTHDGHEFIVTASVGIAIFPDHGRDFEELLGNADASMYHAKLNGRNSSRVFSDTVSVKSLDRLDLELELRKALEHKELHLEYQPKVDIKTWRIVGAEALLRWQHPDRGAISPAVFIPLAEETGLIVDIGNWIIESVCDQIKTWQSNMNDDLSIAINLSPLQFSHDDLVSSIERSVDKSQISPRALQLEITESLLMQDADRAASVLGKLREMGHKIAIDDFGTGYSSLSYLRKFPINSLKIDRSFVNDISSVRGDAVICKAIIAMAHSLDMEVIAEGVETTDQLEFLRQESCDQLQGYLYSKALKADQYIKLYNHQKSPVETLCVG